MTIVPPTTPPSQFPMAMMVLVASVLAWFSPAAIAATETATPAVAAAAAAADPDAERLFKSIVKITTASGDKDYATLLKKYELLNPATNKTMSNRLVIVKFQPVEEFDKQQ